MNELENLKKKILYRSFYRGKKEMDILLSSFVKSCINNLNMSELKDLEKLISLEDDDIYNFYQDNILIDELKHNKLVVRFKNFKPQ
ncbi:MAG: antitoxin CptB [Pelagibacterales bacterium]|nr:antitoxin CptB [Pelagibacterales bacterium]